MPAAPLLRAGGAASPVLSGILRRSRRGTEDAPRDRRLDGGKRSGVTSGAAAAPRRPGRGRGGRVPRCTAAALGAKARGAAHNALRGGGGGYGEAGMAAAPGGATPVPPRPVPCRPAPRPVGAGRRRQGFAALRRVQGVWGNALYPVARRGGGRAGGCGLGPARPRGGKMAA